MKHLRLSAVATLAGALCACSGLGVGGGGSSPAPADTADPLAAAGPGIAEAKSLLDSGDADGALAKLAGNESPDALLLAGDAWAKKSETAPLPTPEPLPPGSPRGSVSVVPEFKPEELRALDMYQKASVGLAQDPRPQLGIARLLAPHARRRYDRAQEQAKKPVKPVKGRKGAPTAVPFTAPPPGPDASPAAVVKAYRAAVVASPPKDGAVLEELYTFAVRTGQLEDADWVLKEAVERDKENPEPLVRYGDFLVQVKKAPDAAISQYRQALIWRPDDTAVKDKISEIYLQMGRAHYEQNEWALAESRYLDALKWAPDPASPQNKRVKSEMQQLKRFRGE